jgi:hypothetical protein
MQANVELTFDSWTSTIVISTMDGLRMRRSAGENRPSFGYFANDR